MNGRTQFDDLNAVTSAVFPCEAPGTTSLGDAQYAVLPSKSNPRWLVPVVNREDMLRELEICQPFSLRGRAWKTAMTASIRCGLGFHARHRIRIGRTRMQSLQRWVKDATGESDCSFAVLIGNGGPFRKATVQVTSTAGEVIGFMKVPLSSAAEHRVRNEAAALTRITTVSSLRGKVPELLGSGSWNGTFVLLQRKLIGETSSSFLSPLHSRFLEQLGSATSDWMPVERVLDRVLVTCVRMPQSLPNIDVPAALRVARAALSGSSVKCGFIHGDFAPWNMRVTDDAVSVFDWERAEEGLPLVWDRYHFVAQAEILLKERSSRSARLQIMRSGTREEQGLYLLYLMHSAATLMTEGVSPSEAAVGLRCSWMQALLEMARNA